MAITSTSIATIGDENGAGTGGGNNERSPPAGTAALVAGAHVPILHLTTSLPAPTGDVSKSLQLVPVGDQRKQAEEFFDFLVTPNPTLSRLNEGTKCYVALVSVPKTSLVKIVYVMGVGSSPIGSMASPVDGKLQLLQGEGNLQLGPPQPLFLPSTMVDKQNIATMTEEQFSTTLTTKGTGGIRTRCYIESQ